MKAQPQNNTKSVANQEAAVQRVIIQKAVLDHLYGIHKEYLEDLAKEMAPGDKREAKNAQGLKMGTVSMTSPNKKAICTDEAILLAAAEDNGAELEDAIPSPDDPRHMEIVNFLADVRPDLLTVRVPKAEVDELAAKVLEDWQITGNVPLGWEIVEASRPSLRLTAPKASAKSKAGMMAWRAIEHIVTGANEAMEQLALEGGQK